MRSRAWPPAEQRALDRIEKTLLDSDRPLRTMYAIFGAITQYDAMPATERIPARPSPRIRALLRPPVLLRTAVITAFTLAAIVLSLLAARQQPCPQLRAAVPAHAQPLRAGPRAPCPARQPGQRPGRL